MTGAFSRLNIAKGKPTWQSSWSAHSKGHDSGGAVTGIMPETFGFHTEVEESPWWMVDLEDSYEIDRIVVHNRIDALAERADTLHVEVSRDGRTWELLFAGGQRFLGGSAGAPLTLHFQTKIPVRLVRLSLRGMQYLHLAQVEIYTSPPNDILIRHGLRTMALAGDASLPKSAERNETGNAYALEGDDASRPDSVIAGLRITRFGRLGNQIIQLANAVALARRIGCSMIKVECHGLFALAESFTQDGITFLSNEMPWPKQGVYLAGNFFFADDMWPLLDDVTGAERQSIIGGIIRPKFLAQLPPASRRRADDELTIHLRSGDIFASAETAQGYTQPPLSFYTKLIGQLVADGEVTQVTLVFEDRGNPCIDKLIHFLKRHDIPTRLQSGSLTEDLAVLRNARRLVFGYGSFGPAVAALSDEIGTVYCFEGLNDREFKTIPTIGKVVVVRDKDGRYTRPGAWQNSITQRLLMLEYPEQALEFAD